MSTYSTFKNTFLFDVLEYLSIIKISEIHNLNNSDTENSIGSDFSSNDESSNTDIEKNSLSNSIAKEQ